MNLLHRSMLFAALSIALPAFAVAALPEGVHRNKDASPNRPQVFSGIQPNGSGLAPTSWGWASRYSGSEYGTGSYAFDENFTYNGYNSIGGYNNQYPSYGFVNEARGVYVFDISGLVGEPSPLWSAFMLDVHSACWTSIVRRQTAHNNSKRSGIFPSTSRQATTHWMAMRL